MNPETWLAYPEEPQIALKSPDVLVARTRSAGVRLLPLAGGVIAATGPAPWFTDDNRTALRLRAVALAAHLERTSPCR